MRCTLFFLALAVVLTPLGALSGCYEPELADCAVACTDDASCATGQVCGADGYCAAPDVAGQCDPDTAPAPNPPPEPTTATLHVVVVGRGRVDTGAYGQCNPGNDGGACDHPVPLGSVLTLVPSPRNDYVFAGWTGAACQIQGELCTLTVTADTVIDASFVLANEGDDGGDD